MKKPRQTPQAKVQNSIERAARRNYQKGNTRRCAAVSQYEAQPVTAGTEVTPPTRARRRKVKKSVRLKLQPGQPHAQSKLTTALTERFCELIRDQMTVEDACTMTGVSRKVVWEWRGRGQQEEHPAYVAFEAALTQALIDAKQKLIKRVAEHTDIRGPMFILKNRYPQEFRDRIVQEISGPEGEPLMRPQINPFQVVIELHSGSPPLEEKPFYIVGTDGVKRLMTGTGDASPIGVVDLPVSSEAQKLAAPPHS